MTNANYNGGRGREYEVVHAFTDDGYKAIRTAGSHSPVDVFAAKAGEANLCIQVKPPGGGTIKPGEREALIEWARAFTAWPIVAYRPRKRAPWEYRRLTGPGPKDWAPWTPDWAVTP